MKLSVTIERYLTFSYTLTDRTKFIYREHLGRLCRYLGDPPLDQVDHWRLAEFMASLRRQNGQPYSAGYLDQIYRSISTFFNFWVGQGLLPANPMRKVKRPKLVGGPKPRLSLVQVWQLLDAIKRTDLIERNLAIVLLMVDCGLRKGEVVALRVSHIDLGDRSMRIYEPKKNKYRDVPLSDMAHVAVGAYLAQRPAATSPAEFVFLMGGYGPTRGQPLTKHAVELLMRRLEKRLGFELYAHLLRHTFGNHYIRRGGLKYLQKILGHSRITTTADFYTDPDFPDIQAEHKLAAPTAQIRGRRESGPT